MRTAILTVGTEILFGQIVNTNAAWLSQQLNDLGYDVMYHYTVGDNPQRLHDLIELAFRDCDLILTTGGLGPTQDDLTKEVICQTMGDSLVVHEPSVKVLEQYAKQRGRALTENNYKQANMPSRAIVLPNDCGTAPGFALESEEGGKWIMSMPGPPREMKRMFDLQIRPILEKWQDSVIYYRLLRTMGIGESLMETVLLPLIDGQTDPTIATYAKEGECSLRIASKRPTLEEAKAAVDEMTEKVAEIIGDAIFSYDNEELVEVVGRILKERNITVACAESCTGGLFAGALTEIPGISAVFDRGIVTYSNRAKIEELGVSKETLEKFGAVSLETAEEMACGLAKVSGCDLCVSVTGEAGPDSSEGKPVGTIYVGICYKGESHAVQIPMRNNGRSWNRKYAVLNMMHEIYKVIS